jgi:hypothetical protein
MEGSGLTVSLERIRQLDRHADAIRLPSLPARKGLCEGKRNFTANSTTKGKLTNLDERGPLSIICAHEFVLRTLLMKRPECFVLIVVLLMDLLGFSGGPALYGRVATLITYDVICQFEPHLDFYPILKAAFSKFGEGMLSKVRMSAHGARAYCMSFACC